MNKFVQAGNGTCISKVTLQKTLMANDKTGNFKRNLVMRGLAVLDLASAATLIPEGKQLLMEYGNYMYMELKLIAGKGTFFMELENFPGTAYAPPYGTFVVAVVDGFAAGCAGVKKFDAKSCEIKRMYVRPAFRGRGIATILCSYLVDWSAGAKYDRILLDTNNEMREAVSLYHKCGFRDIAPYCINENDHPVYMEYVL